MQHGMGNCFKRTMLSIPEKDPHFTVCHSERNGHIDSRNPHSGNCASHLESNCSPPLNSKSSCERSPNQKHHSNSSSLEKYRIICNPLPHDISRAHQSVDSCSGSPALSTEINQLIRCGAMNGKDKCHMMHHNCSKHPLANNSFSCSDMQTSNLKADSLPETSCSLVRMNISDSKSSNLPCMIPRHQSHHYIALFDYNARTDEETSLHRRDEIMVLSDADPDWWFVQHLGSNNKGYVPSSFIARKGSVEAEEWFMPKLSRKDSERLLLLEGNSRGVFLIRESETSQGSLTLSVRDEERSSTGITNTVKHYRIKHPDYQSYFITTKCNFSSLQELVQFYSTNSHGLCCKLTQTCQCPAPITSDLSVKTKDHWEIPKSSIVLTEKLGAGQFGEVWRGIWNDTTEVAVKTLKQGTMTKEEFLKEARIMRAARHPKLVRLYAVCTEDPIYIVTELMCNGSLLHYLRDGPGKNLQLNSLVDMMAQIANGMAYLEKEYYIHRDLAARNILVGENNCVKIADFGLARMVEDHYSTYMAQKSTKFPIKWTAPEAALMGRFTIKSDVWSFGIVIYEIITLGQIPYPSMNNTETLHQISNGYRMPKPLNCPQTIYDILLQIWDSNPDKRPTFSFLFQFFEDYFITSSETNYKHPPLIHNTIDSNLSV